MVGNLSIQNLDYTKIKYQFKNIKRGSKIML